MCRLFGVVASRPVDFRFALSGGKREHSALGEQHPHGWGLGWYDGGNAKRYREALPTDGKTPIRERSQYVRSHILIGHVRMGTRGEARRHNCHPFTSGPWLFAHNGTVNRIRIMPMLEPDDARSLEGDTDSEVYFHYLLQRIAKAGSAAEGLAAAVVEVRRYSFLALNFILTDGKTLYAYREATHTPDYYSLFLLRRAAGPQEKYSAESKELLARLDSDGLAGADAVIVASEALTAEQWRPLAPRTLLIVGQDLAVEERPIG